MIPSKEVKVTQQHTNSSNPLAPKPVHPCTQDITDDQEIIGQKLELRTQSNWR